MGDGCYPFLLLTCLFSDVLRGSLSRSLNRVVASLKGGPAVSRLCMDRGGDAGDHNPSQIVLVESL